MCGCAAGLAPALQLLLLNLRPMRWDLARILSDESTRRTAELAARTARNLRRIMESGTFGVSRNWAKGDASSWLRIARYRAWYGCWRDSASVHWWGFFMPPRVVAKPEKTLLKALARERSTCELVQSRLSSRWARWWAGARSSSVSMRSTARASWVTNPTG